MRRSAALLLTREAPEGPEIYLVERAPQLRFFGGYWAFPGGVVDPVDLREGEQGLEAALERCALRELFEETGVLPEPLTRAIPVAERRALRDSLLAPGSEAEAWRPYADAVEEARRQLRHVTTITTPEFAPLRHTTPFLHLELPGGQEPTILPGELVDGRFWTLDELFSSWRTGELPVVPPALFLLELLRGAELEAFFERARRAGEAIDQGQLHRAYFVPGILTAPLRTPTLPPATTTNTVLVGEERVHVVDPATPEPSEQARLFETLDRWRAEGRRLESVLLTHHHADHVGAVRATAERYGLAVLAHVETLRRLDLSGLVTRAIVDGECLPLGRSPDGREGWELRARHTPGHAAGHLVFIDSRYRCAVVGDLVSTLSTIVIDPPEGHMRTYVESLRAILDEDVGVLIPAHGPAKREGRAVLEYHLARRAQREEKLLGALTAGPGSLDSLLPVVYDDAPEEVLPYARRSLLAGLQKLVEDGHARELEGARWARTTT